MQEADAARDEGQHLVMAADPRTKQQLANLEQG